MNGTNKLSFTRTALLTIGTLAFVAAAGVASCSDNNTTGTTVSYAYDDPYLYTAYYPADVAYSGYYWADSWNYATFYYVSPGSPPPSNTGSAGTTGTTGSAGTTGAGGTTGSAGAGGGPSTTASGRWTISTAIEALARGEQVCPNQVTVTPKFAAPACTGGTNAQVRNGVTISFNGCQVNGGTIDGTFDVQSNRSASIQACDASTVITLGHTTTITNLTFTSSSGGKIVIPSQTDTGMTSYTYGQSPTTLSVSTTGEMQVFNSAGTMLSDHTYSGDTAFSFSGNQSYSVSGTMNVQEKNGTATATLTRTNLTRSGGCCRPTGGTLTVNRTGGVSPGQATWSWGPSCGTVMRNNVTVTLPACI